MISRDELYQLVWSKPMTKVAEQFHVSSTYMARVCALLNVPRPERGHWAKLAVGKAPSPEPLPEARPGDLLSWSNDGALQAPPKPRDPPKRRSNAVVRVPRTDVHSLLRGAKEHFENGRPVDDGAYLKPYKKLLVDVTASRACLDKALGFANALFNALESVGHRVVLAPSDGQLRRADLDVRAMRSAQRTGFYSTLWSPYRPMVVYVGSVAIGLAIVEMSEETMLRYVRGAYIREADYTPPKPSRHTVDHTWTTTRELPSGRLRLVAYSPYGRVRWATDWQETTKAPLHSVLPSIVHAIKDAAVDLVRSLEEADRQAEIARQEWRAADEKRQREDDRRRVEQSVRESQEHLLQIIQQWSHVMEVERFLAGVEARVADLPADNRTPVMDRLTLARAFLGTQNPLDFFLSWRTPEERYHPVYPENGS